jgi:hypothetical protein
MALHVRVHGNPNHYIYVYIETQIPCARGCGGSCRRRGRTPPGAIQTPMAKIQTPMAQGGSIKIISMIKWIRTSRLTIKESLYTYMKTHTLCARVWRFLST